MADREDLNGKRSDHPTARRYAKEGGCEHISFPRLNTLKTLNSRINTGGRPWRVSIDVNGGRVWAVTSVFGGGAASDKRCLVKVVFRSQVTARKAI